MHQMAAMAVHEGLKRTAEQVFSMPPPPIPVKKKRSEVEASGLFARPAEEASRHAELRSRALTSSEGQPKKPTAPGPYRRRLSFRRQIFQSDLEEFICNVLSRSAGSNSLRVLLGRVVCQDTQRAVVLPVNSQAILEERRHIFDPQLTQQEFKAILERLDAQYENWKRGDPAAGRWAEISKSSCTRPAPAEPRESHTVYCPEGGWHFQLQVGSNKGAKPEGEQKVMAYELRKDKSNDSISWRVAICEHTVGRKASTGESEATAAEADVSIKRFVLLEMNTRFLWGQRLRMNEGKSHCFHLLVSALLRNAAALAAVLRKASKAVELIPYYPGLNSDAVQEFYTEKARTLRERERQGKVDEAADASANIRRYNNLVKILLIEQAIDTLFESDTAFSNPRLLDLGCGHGQDIHKYSRNSRKVELQEYVGVDFANGAIEEARRRHAQMCRRSKKPEYPAHFYTGDVRSPSIFQKLRADGHCEFEAVCMMFMLQYIAESKAAVEHLFKQIRDMMPVNGHVLFCIPSCDILADLYEQSSDGDGLGNSLYRVRFNELHDICPEDAQEKFPEVWGISYTFSLVGAVDAQKEYVVPFSSFEDLLNELGFEILIEGSFPDLLESYQEFSPYYSSFFVKDARHRKLTEDEEALFSLYTGVVLKVRGSQDGADSDESHDGESPSR